MGKKIYNFDDFVNESYLNEGLFSWLKDKFERLTGWTKSFFQLIKNDAIKKIPYGPGQGNPAAMLFIPENGPIEDQIKGYKTGSSYQGLKEAVIPLEYTGEDGSVRNIKIEELKDDLIDLYVSKIKGGRAKAIFIYGAPGIGKTEAVAQVATQLDLSVLYLDLQFMGPEDFIGVPIQYDIRKPEFSEVIDKETGKKEIVVIDFGSGFTRSNPPCILPRDNGANGKGGIIFMDEANRANPIVLKSLMQFVQKGRIGDYNLPPKWVIVAAGNRPEEAEVVEPEGAFAERFTFVNYVPELGVDPESGAITGGWAKWASSSGKIIPELIYFLADNRDLFHRLDTEKKALNFPTPRSWTDGSLILGDYMRNKGLSSWRDVPATKLKNIFFDQVGPQAAGKFADFLDILRIATDSDIEEMLTDPDGARVIHEFKKEKRFLFGLIQALINKIPNGDPEKLLNMVKYISRYGQFEVLTWLMKRIHDKFPEFAKIELPYKDEPGWEFRREAAEIIRQGKKEQGL
jgi:hypothetical protein